MNINATRRIEQKSRKAIINVVLLSLILVGPSGCLLRATGGFVFTDDLRTFINLVFDDVSTAYCRDIVDPGSGETINECEYSIVTEDGSTERTSTVRLISEAGVFGVLIDPVIVQVPEQATFDIGTVDDGSGPQDLIVTETRSFNVQPGVETSAEAGQKFWIIELPAAVESSLPDSVGTGGPVFSYNFAYNLPPVAPGQSIPIRVMNTGRVEIGADRYYVPLYPCTTDFSQVPEILIPQSPDLSGFIFDLLFLFGLNNPDLGCNDVSYDFTPIDQIIVPDVTGLPQANAEAAIVAAGLSVGDTTLVPSDTVPAGNVINQDPGGGASVGAGSLVDLEISSGPSTVVVPDVTGLPQANAEAQIVAAGLTVGAVTFATSNSVPDGSVINQDPGGGAAIGAGSPVDLEVSIGPATVVVPDVTGLPQATAETAIVNAGLAVGNVTLMASDTVPAGNVISQNPGGGASVSPGSLVDLEISSGPSNVIVPDVTGLPQATAETSIVNAGLAVGNVTLMASDTVPAGNVISQNPGGGASVSSGSLVDLEISSGPSNVIVPDVTGLPQSTAETAVINAGLVVGDVTLTASDTVPAGNVIGQNPGGGAAVSPGSPVNLDVSSGPDSNANQVTIDIRPGSKKNKVVPYFGVIPVAILGSERFDVLQVDISSVTFGPAAAHPSESKYMTRDVNRDGFIDLVLFFRARQTGIRCGDTEATLVGKTALGSSFAATDRVKTVGCR